ncbi:hypothetical protein, partial [Bifidobacterium pseudolongum]|uniref:hypothetical protein n=1 Tax=Bifidobacterium pseudolongum TaxID=1694 RepID=UPI001A9259FC
LEGVAVIEADRHALGNVLSGQHFDAVIDVTAYNAQDVDDLARPSNPIRCFGDCFRCFRHHFRRYCH